MKQKIYTRLFILVLLVCSGTRALAQLPPLQPEQDACNAIHLCGNVFTTPYSYVGYGNIQEQPYLASGGICFVGPESASVWFRLEVATPGLISFTLKPVNTTDDYDFYIHDITGKTCDSTGISTLIRVEANDNFNSPGGLIGLKPTATITCATAGTSPPFVQSITANTGDVYLILVNNFTQSNTGFTINFGASTATFVGLPNPDFDTVATACDNSAGITFHLTQKVQCNSVDPDGSDFVLNPPIAAVTSEVGQNCVANGYTENISVTFNPPLPNGHYTLNANVGTDGNTLLGLCGDPMLIPDSISFDVNVLAVNAGIDTTTCVGSPLQLQATFPNGPPVGPYTVQWSPASSLNNSTILNPIATPANDVSYVVTVNSQVGSLSCGSKDTVNVAVLQGFNINNHDTSICAGSSVQITGTGDTRYTYNWTPTTNLTSTNTINTTSTPTATTTYTLTGSYPGCIDSTKSIKITVEPIPVVFAGNDTTLCPGDTLYMGNASVSPSTFMGYTYSWTPASAFDLPNVLHPHLFVPDTVAAALTVTTPAGCTSNDTIHVGVLQGFHINNHDTSICSGNSVQITGTGDSRYTYSWTPTNALSSTNTINTTSTTQSTITYTLAARYPTCPDTVQTIKITVEPQPVVYAGPDTLLCFGDTLRLSLATVTPSNFSGYTYSWTPATSFDDASLLNPNFIASDTLTATLTVKTPIGCTGIDSFHVIVIPPHFLVLSDDTAICPHDSITLHASGASTYVWTPNTAINSTTGASVIVQPLNSIAYTIYATEGHGCIDSGTVQVKVNPAALVTLPDSVRIYPGDTYQMDPQGNCLYFNWFPPLGLSNNLISNPIAQPPVDTRYYVTAATEEGCKTRDSIDVFVNDDSNIDVPNAFSPGNGSNGYIHPVHNGNAQLRYFRIFNRWGEKVFESNDIDAGWDGTINGTPQPMGVYVYEVQAVTPTGRVFTKHGNITLIR